MKIPVFHDDQHGTAIIVGAAIRNGLQLVGKKLDEVKLVTSGAGAAAIACLDLLVDMGLQVENIIVTDRYGVVWRGRKEEMDPRKERYAKDTNARTLGEVIGGADIFLGLSAPDVLKPEMVAQMAAKPLILALANPTPEIMPEEAREARPDAIIATGRTDYPNQVNNVLCFPFIFRGALDVGATTINEAMKLACVEALADLALAPSPPTWSPRPMAMKPLTFGPDYLIPKPFDPRLILELAPAVAKAAMESGVATRPIDDFDAYRQQLDAIRLPLRPRHEAGLRARAQRAEAHRLCRGRGRARAARGAAGARRRHRPADPRRAPRRGARAASSGSICASSSISDVELVDPQGRPALQRILERSITR